MAEKSEGAAVPTKADTPPATSPATSPPTSPSAIDPKSPLHSVYRPRTYSRPPARIVVIAVDDSECAKKALDFYFMEIHRQDDLLVVCHCPETPALPALSFKSGISLPFDDWKKSMEDSNSKIRQLEEDYEAQLIQRKIRYKVRGELSKKPGEGIVRIADEEGAHMIVIGRRGLGAVKRAFMGSVSEYVVRHAGCPVTVVPLKRGRSRSMMEA